MGKTMTRDDVVEIVRRCGTYISLEAENIVGNQTTDMISGGLTVSFTVDRFSPPTIKIEREHICLEALEVVE